VLTYFATKNVDLEDFSGWLKELLKLKGIAYQEHSSGAIELIDLKYTFAYSRIGENKIENSDFTRIWEDWWRYKQDILISKILGKLGLLEKVPARLCYVKKIIKPEADSFLNENHLQGATTAKYKYGIFLPVRYFRVLKHPPGSEDYLMAVMTFSGRRVFQDGSLSYELLRYAVRKGYSLQGGFTKGFQAFVKEKEPDSVMTYADLDWYTGGMYEKFGFKPEGVLPSMGFKVGEDGQRIKVEAGCEVTNKGSIKMLWEKR
jgi:hypothetical protein